MSNLIPMDEAATILGMSVDEVAELRSNNELFGYRDGATWKFKMSELERVADDLGIKLNASGEAAAGIDSVKNKIDDAVSELGLSLEDSSEELVLQEPDSVEYMEDSSVELLASELGRAPSESGSFKDSSIKVQDLDLLADSNEEIDLEDSGLLAEGVMPGPPKGSKKGSEKSGSLSLDSDEDAMDLSGSSIFDGDEALSFGSSSLKMAGGKTSGSDTGDLLDDEPSGKGSPSDTGKDGSGGSDDLLLGDDDLFSDDLSLEDSASFEDSADLSSDFEPSDSLEIVESDSSVELELEKNDAGVNLADSESGISLSSDQPLELGGSDIDALELGDDDDDMIVLDDVDGADDATQLKQDDFNLTPLEDAPEAEIEASGSQVVALENSDIYADEGAATVLGDAEFEADEGLVDVEDGVGMDDDFYGAAATAAAGGVAVAVEAPYNKWQVISLGLVATFLSTGGMVAYDLARNMWTPENQTLGRGVLKFFLGLTGMDS